MAKLTFRTKIGGVLVDVDSVLLSDPTGSYGIKNNDTGATMIADGTAMTRTAAGTYEYDFAGAQDGVEYSFYVEWTYAGATHHVENVFWGSEVASNWVNVE
jgi:hypothetical protein